MVMGVGMGLGMGLPDMIGGSSGCSMIQVPPMHGALFPFPIISASSALKLGGSNIHVHRQGQEDHFLRTSLGMNTGGVIGPIDNFNSGLNSCSKDPVHKVSNSKLMQTCGANSSMNQTFSQCRATNECFKQSALGESSIQASEVADSGASKSADGNENA